MSALLQVENLTVDIETRRGVLRALDDVSFDIEAGKVLGVVGESGAGKSLTGAAVIGLLERPMKIVRGRVLLAGQRIDDLTPRERQALLGRSIGAVFQDPLASLNPLMTIGRQLTQTIETHLPVTRSEALDRAVRLLSEVGIASPRQRLGAYPHELSGGMRQRVVLALAFACEPSLVVADEPTTALDVSVQAQVIALLKRLCHDHGTSILLITHDMGVIAEAADRVAVMYAGRLIEEGSTIDVLNRPLHPYTSGLVGSIPSLLHVRDDLVQIPGSMPRLGALPSGCAFHPRCGPARNLCGRDRPAVTTLGSGENVRRAACWLLASEQTA